MTTTREERLMAALAHGLVITYGLGVIGAAVIWQMQKEKSRYVAFQAVQAAVYQLVGMFLYLVSWACWGCFYSVSFIPVIAQAQKYKDAPPPIFWIGIGSMVIPMVLMGVWALYGLWGTLRTLQGQDFRYAVVGRWLERFLAANSA